VRLIDTCGLFIDRDELARRVVKHYSRSPKVDRIILSWNNLGRAPPDVEWFESNVPLFIVREAVDSLNNRFKPNPLIETEAVFNVDDDIEIPLHAMEFAFSIWQQFPRQMVGFYPRSYMTQPSYPEFCLTPAAVAELQKQSPKYYYNLNCVDPLTGETVTRGDTSEFAIVLDSMIFHHKRYMDAYFEVLPRKLRDLVDEKRNCEDLVLPYLMSHLERLPPVLVSHPEVDGRTEHLQFQNKLGHHPGLNTQDGHYFKRNQCMQILYEEFGYQPLLHSNFAVSAIGQPDFL
jgi:hypothetical protein